MRREDLSSTNNCDVRKTKKSGVRRAELQLQQQCEKCGAKSASGFQVRLSGSCVAIPGVVVEVWNRGIIGMGMRLNEVKEKRPSVFKTL